MASKFLRLLPLALWCALAATASPMVIVILGPPASGQTTQAQALKKALQLPVVSVEALLLEEAGPRSEEARRLSRMLESGTLQKLDFVNDLVRQRLSKPDVQSGCIVDGYPRTWKQAQDFENLLKDKGFQTMTVFVLDVPDAELRDRLRRSGRVKTVEEADQKIAAFRREVDAITAHFAERIQLVNGNQPPAKVTAEILRHLGK